jgi:hypothetical protein
VTRALSALGAAAFTFVLCACQGAEKREAERVLGAIEHLRSADAPERPALLERLESMTSTVLPAEVARKACAEAFRALDDTERLVKEAKGPPVDQAKLDAAVLALAKAKAGHEACNARVAELKRFLKTS